MAGWASTAAWPTYLLVPDARHLVPLPDGLDPVDAAPLTDAGLTPYHAVRRSAGQAVPGSDGGGHRGRRARAHGGADPEAVTAARVVAVDPRQEARTLAADSGADVVLEPGPDLVEQIRELAHGRGADVVLDMVGSDETLASAAAATRQLGDLTIVGIAGGTLPVSFFGLPYEVSVQTTYWGNRAELVEVLDLAARGLLRPEITTFPLEEAAAVYAALAAGNVAGRAVVVPFTDYDPDS